MKTSIGRKQHTKKHAPGGTCFFVPIIQGLHAENLYFL
ncbi:hypothetical protein QY96_01972 [Bacillus thermotolerans]|uniref:Uncharacterized protein n=1 Tax=Bacillus thermotolerans TaxID=1221996 RepID=A0A0F5IAU5_BACTR|nr:hypothetical protein QY96_01972 [Bacillus thermotolerans]KKB42724.1 hypothetical protein QY95_03745 [Bacillus thermotolerans]